MPPRWLTIVIVVFWLTMTAWFCYREIWPYYRPGQPPPISFGLTDEVGGNTSLWDVYFQKTWIGTSKSEVLRREDGTYDLAKEIKFVSFPLTTVPLLGMLQNWIPEISEIELRRVTTTSHVTMDGRLLGIREKAIFGWKSLQWIIELRGKVKDSMLEFTVTSDDPLLTTSLQAVPQQPVPIRHNILNTLQLIDHVPGLREGQHWSVQNPIGSLPGIGQEMTIPLLEALVVRDEMTWNAEQTPCWKIEYRQPNEKPVLSATWVRQRDALVLRQEVNYAKMNVVLQRQPVKDE